MSFKNRLIIVVTAALALILLANFIVSGFNARHYFSEQLSVLSSDAATSLGFAISHAAKEKDLALINSMVDVIFDSGHYLRVAYTDVDGVEQVSRSRDIRIETVPQWFVEIINVPSSKGVAEVHAGWFRLGEVEVVAHPGYIYQDLWRLLIEMLWLFLASALAALLLVGALTTALTRPLKRLESQAEAIGQEEFRIEKKIPNIPEFRRVVLAMNGMAHKLRTLFSQQIKLIESLRSEAHMDALTGLPNRLEFDARANAWLESELGNGPALLMLVSIQHLEKLNSKRGRDQGDQLVVDIADCLKRFSAKNENAILGRRSGTDFSLYLPGLYLSDAKTAVEQLGLELKEVSESNSALECPAVFGVAHSMTARPLHQWLTAADGALRAQDQYLNGIEIVNLERDSAVHRSASDWLPILEKAVESQALTLYFQPAYRRDLNVPVHYEVLCRIQDGDQLIRAGTFWPLVERFGLQETLDKEVIRRVLEVLTQYPENSLSVNLSPVSVAAPAFLSWLVDNLKKHPITLRKRLLIEVPETILRSGNATLNNLLKAVDPVGCLVGVDRFGLLASAIGQINELPLAFVKLDRRFVTGIAESRENRLYIQTLQGICAANELTLFAEGVEEQEELSTLQQLNIEGFQGFLLGRPEQTFIKEQ